MASIRVTFCIGVDVLRQKAFYPKFLYRADKKPDLERDTDLILDAYAFLKAYLMKDP